MLALIPCLQKWQMLTYTSSSGIPQGARPVPTQRLEIEACNTASYWMQTANLANTVQILKIQ